MLTVVQLVTRGTIVCYVWCRVTATERGIKEKLATSWCKLRQEPGFTIWEDFSHSGECFFKSFSVANKITATSFYRPQRSWGKVIFSEACIKNSVHIREQCMLGDTDNKRVVRILVECILVF